MESEHQRERKPEAKTTMTTKTNTTRHAAEPNEATQHGNQQALNLQPVTAVESPGLTTTSETSNSRQSAPGGSHSVDVYSPNGDSHGGHNTGRAVSTTTNNKTSDGETVMTTNDKNPRHAAKPNKATQHGNSQALKPQPGTSLASPSVTTATESSDSGQAADACLTGGNAASPKTESTSGQNTHLVMFTTTTNSITKGKNTMAAKTKNERHAAKSAKASAHGNSQAPELERAPATKSHGMPPNAEKPNPAQTVPGGARSTNPPVGDPRGGHATNRAMSTTEAQRNPEAKITMKTNTKDQRQTAEPNEAAQHGNSQAPELECESTPKSPGLPPNAEKPDSAPTATDGSQSTNTQLPAGELEEWANAALEHLFELGIQCPEDGVHNALYRPAMVLLESGMPFEVAARAIRLWVAGKGASRRAAGDVDREIEEALLSAQEELKLPAGERARRKRAPAWPPPDPDAIRKVTQERPVTFSDLVSWSPFKWPSDVRLNQQPGCRRTLSILFPDEDALICIGKTKAVLEKATGGMREVKYAWTKPLKEILRSAPYAEYVVPNMPVSAYGLTKRGEPSRRAKEMFPDRHYLVLECDPPPEGELSELLNWDGQANILHHLGRTLPLVCVVHSAGKSLHGWYRADSLSDDEVLKFYRYARGLGADYAAYQPHQLVRLPWGLRMPKVNYDTGEIIKPGGVQRVIYLAPARALGARPADATEDEHLLTNVPRHDLIAQLGRPGTSEERRVA